MTAGRWGTRFGRPVAVPLRRESLPGMSLRLFWIGAVGLLVFLAFESVSMHRGNIRLYDQARLLEMKVERLSRGKESLAREHKALEQDPFYAERLLMEKNMVKPGERVIKTQ